MLSLSNIDALKKALEEDINYIDITSDNLIDSKSTSQCKLICKEDGVLSGIEVFKEVFNILDPSIEITFHVKDGDSVKNKELLADIFGSTRNILKGERVALNFLQRMSGVASLTKLFVSETKGTNTRIVDTRKTTPLLRSFEKMAVVHGGAFNHRFNLSDSVMIKDNHIKACGGIKEALQLIKTKVGLTTKVEIEVETMEQFKEALHYKADIIMLDNMTTDLMRECVVLNNRQSILEASGNMTVARINEVSKTGVDYISVGALTHSYTSLDISLKF